MCQKIFNCLTEEQRSFTAEEFHICLISKVTQESFHFDSAFPLAHTVAYIHKHTYAQPMKPQFILYNSTVLLQKKVSIAFHSKSIICWQERSALQLVGIEEVTQQQCQWLRFWSFFSLFAKFSSSSVTFELRLALILVITPHPRCRFEPLLDYLGS